MKVKMLVVLAAVVSMVAGAVMMANANYTDVYKSEAHEFNGYIADTSSTYNERYAVNEGKGDGDGNCDNLTNITGTLSQDGRYFYVDGIKLCLGPYWYISIKEASYDYDGDGVKETILDELEGLVGTTVTITGCIHEGIFGEKITVFYINGMLYREPSKPFWAGGRH